MFGSYRLYNGFTRCHIQIWCNKHPRWISTRPRPVFQGPGAEKYGSGARGRKVWFRCCLIMFVTPMYFSKLHSPPEGWPKNLPKWSWFPFEFQIGAPDAETLQNSTDFRIESNGITSQFFLNPWVYIYIYIYIYIICAYTVASPFTYWNAGWES